MLSCIYLTRKCPMRCYYCRIVESPLHGQDLSVAEWKKAFGILKARGVKFHLILGNEPLLYDGIVELMDWLTNVDGTPYGFYSTSPQHLLDEKGQDLVDAGLNQVSSGVDRFPLSDDGLQNLDKDSDYFVKRKSHFGLAGMRWYQERGVPDLHGTVTITKRNKDYVLELLKYLTGHGMWTAVNPVHYDKDGGYDFFPPKSIVEDDLLTQEEWEKIADELKKAQLNGEIATQNPPEFFDAMKKYAADDNWHCSKPLIYTVDCDGSMRCCGYRRGNEATALTVFDLETDAGNQAYWEAWDIDQGNCPGCFWSYWWQAEHFLEQEQDETDFGHRFFQYHAMEYFQNGAYAGNKQHTVPQLISLEDVK